MNIDTLTDDIKDLLERKEDKWTHKVTHYFSESLAKLAEERFMIPEERRGLSLSMMGKPCNKQKWYMVNHPELGEELDYKARGTFFFGDMIEVWALSMAMATGHSVTNMRQKTDVHGAPGSLDAIIDGHKVDVKSASNFGFVKFKNGTLRDNDPFGYISQLSSYLYGEQNNPDLVDRDKASFLTIRKDRFDTHLDTHDLKKELERKEVEAEQAKIAVSSPNPPMRGIDDVPDGKSGNRKLAINCSYCSFKEHCWPEARKFAYSDGIRWLTKVDKLPRVPEII